MDRLPIAEHRIDRRALLRRGGLGIGALAATRVLGAAAPAGASTTAAGFGRTVTADNLAFARVWPRTARQIAAVANLDGTHAIFGDGSAELLLWPGDRTKLDALGITYEIFVPQAQHETSGATGLLPQPGERTEYRRLGDYTADMQALATKYPTMTRLFTYPEPSLEGRLVYGLEIADDIAAAQRDGRPVFHVDGVHHAREWPSAELPIMFAHDLLESYGKEGEERMTAIVAKARIVITPIVNPDGFHHSREAPTDQDVPLADRSAYWRKNKRSFSNALYPAGAVNPYLNADAHGTDPNRNYPTYWGGEGGNANPVDATYAGSAPYAEPESRNIAGMMKSNQVTAYLTNHTHGRLCMRPWGFTSQPSPDSAFQTQLGAQMVAHNKYTNQIGLSLYPTSGTSRDWSYDALRTIVYTFEHLTAFHPSYLSNIPNMYKINRVPLMLLAEAAIDPANHGVVRGRVVDAATGAPLQAEVRLSKTFKTRNAAELDGRREGSVTETIVSSHDGRPDGTFEVHCNPSTRPTVKQFFGGTETWTVDVSANGRTHSAQVFLERGDVHDFGTITL